MTARPSPSIAAHLPSDEAPRDPRLVPAVGGYHMQRHGADLHPLEPIAPRVRTATFKPIAGRWHIAKLCSACRGKIWVCVEDEPLDGKSKPLCGECE